MWIITNKICNFVVMVIRRLIPNLLTAGNLIGGILAIIFALTGDLELAPYCILAAALFDFLDGFVARLLKVQSELGKQLDSLADMVTFGVAPGILMLMILNRSLSSINPDYVFLSWFALIIPVFALFRLAKFNLDARQSDSFIGLPTPAMT
jgi:CDP-diacylglycerol--serine O-phosphatidyltransferase